jgi:hypothetical protein
VDHHYGSSRKGEYRLLETDSDTSESELLAVCIERSLKPAVDTFRGLAFVDSGWEWSIFRHGIHVFKIPSGRFKEVSNPRYLLNAEINYQKILRYVDEKYAAETQFNTDFIQQELIDAQRIETIDLRKVAEATRKELICLFSRLLILLQREDWLPDLDIELKNGRVEMKNWLFDRNGIPKIIDFTSYCDVFRLNERRLQLELPKQEQRLVEALRLLS